MDISTFYKDRKVLVTGHTGFKGSWLCHILLSWGAQVTGYALEPKTQPSLFTLTNLKERMDSVAADIRNREHLQKTFERVQPEIVFHLAAQPLVRTGYQDPVGTYETNVMGTVNLLECVRLSESVKSVINVTTDKVYANQEWLWGYRENELLDGHDPYANSKSCSELVSACYVRSFLQEKQVALSTLRAGNVIGGGDFALDRIVPDCVRHALHQQSIVVRNPNSVRPYQHVLEPLLVYLQIAKEQIEQPSLAGSYNVGPNEDDCITTGNLAQLFCEAWGGGQSWHHEAQENAPHEAHVLRLDCSKVKATFNWRPCWDVKQAIQQTVNWYKVWQFKGDLSQEIQRELELYLKQLSSPASPASPASQA